MADFVFSNKTGSSDFSSTGDKVNEIFGDLLLNRTELEAMITSLKRRQYGATPPSNPNTGDIWECSTTGGGYTATVVYRYNGSAWAELIASAVNIPNRNTVIQGKVTAAGAPDLFEAGTGLAVKLNATATPAIFAFMNGNSTSLGTVDIVAAVSADAATFWSSLPTSSTVYLYVDYTTGTVSGGFTTLAPVYQNIAPTHSAGLHWLDFNTGKVWSSDGSAWTQRNRIFVGTATTDGSGVTAVDVYAYNVTQEIKANDIITKGPWVDVRAFGAVGDGVHDDTAAVQAAFDSGKPVLFGVSCYVQSVVISGVGKTIDFNGHSLVGIAVNSPDYLLAITGRELTLYNVKVNCNFKPYTSAVRWCSLDAGSPAQYNNVYGMHIMYAAQGLCYGNSIGSPPVDAAQSENTIHNLTFRGVQTCFIGNQGANGYITLVAPILDCNPYEWGGQPGYNGTSWALNSRCFNNPSNNTLILGGELLKTTSQTGYGFEGNGVTMIGTIIEIACKWGYLTGSMTIKDADKNGYMASDASSAFVVAASAGTGQLLLDNVFCYRGAAVASYSSVSFIDASACPTYIVKIQSCTINEWMWRGSDSPLIKGCPFSITDTLIGTISSTRLVNTDNTNVLLGIDSCGGDLPSDGSLSDSWTAVNVYGGGDFAVKRGPATSFPSGFKSSIEYLASGGATLFNSRFFKVNSEASFLLTFYSLWLAGTNQNISIYFYDKNRVQVGEAALIKSIDGGASTFTSYCSAVPATAEWARFTAYGELAANYRITNLKMSYFFDSKQSDPTIYVSSIPTTGLWVKGEKVYLLSPTAGGYTGYVCTAGGTPGTWKGFGLIQA